MCAFRKFGAVVIEAGDGHWGWWYLGDEIGFGLAEELFMEASSPRETIGVSQSAWLEGSNLGESGGDVVRGWRCVCEGSHLSPLACNRTSAGAGLVGLGGRWAE